MEETRIPAKQESIYKENSIAELPVVRVSGFGAFLDGGTGNSKDDILLHKGQQTHEVKEGERVKVFLYHDPHHRLTASMRLPQIAIGGIGYAPVLLTTRFGAFVDVGTERGIFLPFSQMIENVTEGQQIWVKLYEDKTGRLAVTMHVDEEMRAIALPFKEAKLGDTVTGTVYNETGEGLFLVTRDRHLAFIHKTELARSMRLGEEVTGRISFSDFSSLKGLVVFTDTFLDLNGNFNYVLFYPIWAGVTALHIVCCIYYGYYYGENIKWWLLIVFLVILILGPLISTIVFYGITGKNSGFDFFALILATFSLFLGIIVFLVLFIDRVTIKRRTFKLRGKENRETKELMDYFIDFERKGMIGEYKGYLKRWLAITGGED